MIQEQIDILIKAFETGKLDYDSLIEKGVHKYIRKESDGKGGWNYIYRDQEEHSKQEFTNDVKLGHSGKFIKKTTTNPAQVYKGISKWLNDTKKKWEPSFSRTTSSRYITTEDEGNTYKIRIANHSPAISDEGDWKGVDVQSYGDGTVHVDIDSSFGYKTEDIKNIIEISKQTAKEIGNKEANLTLEEVYGKYSKSEIEELSSKVLKDLGIEEDYYGINKQFAESLIQDFKQTASYKKYVEEKKKEESKKDINEKLKLQNGIELTVQDNWFKDISFPEHYMGGSKKNFRKEIKDYLMYTLGNKLTRTKELSKEDYLSEANKYIEQKEAQLTIVKALNLGLLDYNKIEKAHKYIKREGNKGNYKYFYNDNIEENGKENREQLNRLSPEEERGRLLGGRINAEATNFIRENERTGSEGEGTKGKRLEQIKLLEEFSKIKGVWHEDLESFLDKKEFLDEGSENKVFISKDKGFVNKINSLLVDKTPLDYLDRLAIHNTLFPDVYYEVVGFGKDEKGRFSVLTKQPFIQNKEEVRKRDVDEYMAKLGFKPDGLYSYSNDKYIISDVHEGNVLKNGDSLYFIDTFISKNDLIQKAQTKDYGVGKHTEEVQVTNKKTGKTYYRKEIVGRKQEDEKKGRNKKSVDQPEKKYTTEELNEHAKNATLNDLQRTIKESPDPDLRMTAHNEIARREQEEHVQDQEKDQKETREDVDKNSKKLEKDSNEHVDKFRQLSDEQVKFYLDAPYPKVKEAAQIVADERGLSVVSKEDYIKQFEDWSDKDNREEVLPFYDKDAQKSKEYLSKNHDSHVSIELYKEDGFKDIRDFISNPNEFKDTPTLEKRLKNDIENISNFINDNKIENNLTLHRMVLTGNTFFPKLKEGDVYEDKSFSSTSLKKITAFGDFHIKILAKKGSKVANLNNRGEKEYLIDKGSKFRVIEKQKDGLGITVELL